MITEIPNKYTTPPVQLHPIENKMSSMKTLEAVPGHGKAITAELTPMLNP